MEEPTTTAITTIGSLGTQLESIEKNPIFAAICSITVFVTSRYLIQDMSNCVGKRLENDFVVFLAVFSVIFVNVRSLNIGLFIGFLYFIVRDIILDECYDQFIW